MILLVTVGLSSCAAIGDIFEAGMWIGVIGVVLVVALVFWLFSKFFR